MGGPRPGLARPAPEAVSGHDAGDAGPAATPKALRVFGLGLGLLLLGCAWLRARSGRDPSSWAAAAGLAAFLALARPAALGRVYRPWMAVVRVIGRVNQFLVLALVYYAAFAPYGWLLRLAGKDPLGQRDGRDGSYWSPHETDEDGIERYRRQF